MTISDLMKYLQIKKTKARQLHSKKGLGVKIGGSVRFKKSEIDEYLQKNGKTVKIKHAVLPIQD